MDQSASLLGEADAGGVPRLPHPRGRGHPARLRRGRPRAAHHRHQGQPLARDRRLRRAPRLLRGAAPRRWASRRCATSRSTTSPRAAELLDDETFRRVRHIVTENQRVLDTVRTLREHGPARDRRHCWMPRTSRCATTSRSRCAELDLAVETAVAAGAIGARMTGGGFGGAAIALTPTALDPGRRGGGARRVRRRAATGRPTSSWCAPRPGPAAPPRFGAGRTPAPST